MKQLRKLLKGKKIKGVSTVLRRNLIIILRINVMMILKRKLMMIPRINLMMILKI